MCLDALRFLVPDRSDLAGAAVPFEDPADLTFDLRTISGSLRPLETTFEALQVPA